MDTLTIIEKKKGEFQPLWARMDATAALLYDKYKMRDWTGETVLDDVYNVTSNKPKTFFDAISSDIMAALQKQQTIVEGDNLNSSTKQAIERYLEDCYSQADEEATLSRYPRLYPWLSRHVCHRSFVGARVMFVTKKRYGKEITVPEIFPVDMRHAVYEYGEDGLEWVACYLWDSGDSLMRRYNITGLEGKASVPTVLFYDKEKEEVFIDGKKQADREPHRLGEVPFVIDWPASGAMLRDKDWLKNEGEDIFWLDRDLYQEDSRLLSISMTGAMDIIKPPYQRINPQRKTDPSPYPKRSASTADIDPAEGMYELVPLQDVNRAYQIAEAKVSQEIAIGQPNLSDITDPNLDRTAVWISEQTELRTKFLHPRLECIESFERQVSRMLIEQGKKFSSLELGRMGFRKKHNPSTFGNPLEYTIDYTLMSESKAQEIANLMKAEAAKSHYSELDIHKNILLTDDPEGAVARLNSDKAKAADPALMYFDLAYSIAQEADSLPAGDEKRKKEADWKLLMELYEKARMQGSVNPQENQPKGNAQPLASLMGSNRMGI
jgi:hypothetical protein